MANHKVPRFVKIVNAQPLTPSNRVVKPTLWERATELLDDRR